ncbi:MAG: glycosyltransferase N-terminal domain-containing protein [Pseudomonadota bacterium]
MSGGGEGSGSIALSAYLALSAVAGPVAPALLARRRQRGKEDGARLGERLGRPAAPRPEGALVWLHGASVGEGMSLLPVVEGLLALPAPPTCLLTTGTLTSAQLIAPRLAALSRDGRALHQFAPVDTRGAVRGFLNHWRPDLAIWAESEFWPRLMWETAGARVPMMLVNARVSAKSAAGWRRVPRMAGKLVGLFARIDAQDDTSAALLAGLGADPAALHVSGNIKTLLPPPDAAPEALSALRAVLGERRRWLAASTHAPEEVAAVDAHLAIAGGDVGGARAAPLLTMIAPRHPDRAQEVAEIAALRGLPHTRRSRGEGPPRESGVWILDTLGEMGLWYRSCPVAFLGGSLAPMGGHNPFEPAALGTALVAGPSTQNFAPAYAALAEAGGYRAIRGPEELAPAVAALLGDAVARRHIAASAELALAGARPDLAPIIDAAAGFLGAHGSGGVGA